MKKTFPVILLMIVILISSSIYVIKEGEQAIVTQFGKPVSGSITSAGLKLKIPLIQKVIKLINHETTEKCHPCNMTIIFTIVICNKVYQQ